MNEQVNIMLTASRGDFLPPTLKLLSILFYAESQLSDQSYFSYLNRKSKIELALNITLQNVGDEINA